MGFYELTKGRHLRGEQILTAGKNPGEGDILELSEEAAEKFGLHRLRYIGPDLTAVKAEEARRNKVKEKEREGEEGTKEPEKKTRK